MELGDEAPCILDFGTRYMCIRVPGNKKLPAPTRQVSVNDIMDTQHE